MCKGGGEGMYTINKIDLVQIENNLNNEVPHLFVSIISQANEFQYDTYWTQRFLNFAAIFFSVCFRVFRFYLEVWIILILRW